MDVIEERLAALKAENAERLAALEAENEVFKISVKTMYARMEAHHKVLDKMESNIQLMTGRFKADGMYSGGVDAMLHDLRAFFPSSE